MSEGKPGRIAAWLEKRRGQKRRYEVEPAKVEARIAKRLLFLPTGERVEVSGEASYQGELSRLVGGKSFSGHNHPVVAVLFPDDDNKYDPNAIEVVVNELLVGYIPRDLCLKFRELTTKARERGAFLATQAVIVGGWNRGDGDEGHFGIYLDVALEEQFGLPGAPVNQAGEEMLQTAPTRTLIPVSVDRVCDVVGESSHGWDIAELIGTPNRAFDNESLLVTIKPIEDGGFDVIALGTRQRVYGLSRSTGRKIGSVAKKDRAYWQSVYDSARARDGYPLIEAVVNGYDKNGSTGKRDPVEVRIEPLEVS